MRRGATSRSTRCITTRARAGCSIITTAYAIAAGAGAGSSAPRRPAAVARSAVQVERPGRSRRAPDAGAGGCDRSGAGEPDRKTGDPAALYLRHARDLDPAAALRTAHRTGPAAPARTPEAAGRI